MTLHLIEEDLGLTPEGLGPPDSFEEPETWISSAVDQLEQEIERSFRNHSAFERWLKAHSHE